MIETGNPSSDSLRSSDAQRLALHEGLHTDDFKVNGLSTGAIMEAIPCFIERLALKSGDFYSNDADKLMAHKILAEREARIYVTLRAQQGQMSPKEVSEFLQTSLKLSPDKVKAEVKRTFEDPLWQLSYGMGADALEALWTRVQAQKKDVTLKQFVDGLINLGPNDTGNILEYGKKTYGIDLTAPLPDRKP